jgi:hypothetical protein
MLLLNIILGLILVISFIDGFGGGAIKNFFSLIIFFITVPLTGISFHLIATAFSFISGENWSHFIGFFITLALYSIIFHFVFYLPRKYAKSTFHEGILMGLGGSIINVFKSAMGIVVLLLVFHAYPVIRGLEPVIMESGVLTWLLGHFRFVQLLLPDTFALLI